MKLPLRFCLLCILFIFAARQISAQGKYIDSLKTFMSVAKDDSARMGTLYSLSLAFVDSANFEDAISYATQLRQLSKKVQALPGHRMLNPGFIAEANSWNALGQVEFSRSNNLLALKYYDIALKLYKVADAQPSLAEVYSNIASAYATLGDYDNSLDFYLKSLKMDEEAKDSSHIAIDYLNIAAILNDSENRAESHKYKMKALELNKKTGNLDGVAICYNNLGAEYQFTADSAQDKGNNAFAEIYYQKALGYYSQSMQLHLLTFDKDGIAISSENTGTVYFRQGKYREALESLMRAFEIYESMDMKAEMSYCLSSIGKVYQKQNKIAEAEKYLLQSLSLAKETGSNDFLMKSNEFLSKFYEERNRPAEALRYFKDYLMYHDKIFNQEATQKLVRKQMGYEFDKQQSEAKAQHEKEIIVLEGENKIQRQLRLFLFLVIGLFVIILVFVQRAYNNKKRLSEFLAAEDSRKELLLQEVHHRINNNLQIISSLLSLQANSADDERLTVYLKQSQNRIQSLSVLHELLYQNNSSLQVEMNDYIDKVLDFHRDVAGTHAAKIVLETDVQTVKFPTKIAVPLALIINELVTNSLKYAFAEKASGKIKISLKAMDENALSWQLLVQDDGKGLGEIAERRKGSLGLRLVNIMVKQIGAKMQIREGEGAVFEIAFMLPKKK